MRFAAFGFPDSDSDSERTFTSLGLFNSSLVANWAGETVLGTDEKLVGGGTNVGFGAAGILEGGVYFGAIGACGLMISGGVKDFGIGFDPPVSFIDWISEFIVRRLISGGGGGGGFGRLSEEL